MRQPITGAADETSVRSTALTAEEATSRAALVEVERYDISLDLASLADGAAFTSTSRISLQMRQSGSVHVDLSARAVTGVLVDGTSRTPDVDGDRLRLTDLPAGPVVVVVSSVHDDTSQRRGLHRSVDPSDGEVYVWTTFEPFDAHRVFACLDQPDLKAVVAFTVTAPDGWSVHSGAPVIERSRGQQSGTTVWRFADTPRLPVYVTTVCAGPFHTVSRQHGDITLGLACRRSLADYLDAATLFDLTARGLDFFGGRFDLPFPGTGYDQVFLPDMGGAMENWACVTWSDMFLFRSPPSAIWEQLRAIVLLHEMAHMWFGDMVTMRWWEDLWLNEAFADWAAYWAVSQVQPWDDTWASFVALRRRVAMETDTSPRRHPVSTPVADTDQAGASFDMITYGRGAAVLRQLSARIGEERFLDGLCSYFRRHQWGNATFGDLLGELSAAGGEELGDWAQSWLRTAGITTLQVEAGSSDGRYDEVVVHQRAEGDVPLRSHHVLAALYDRLPDGTLSPRARLPLRIEGAETTLTMLAGLDTPALLILDDEQLSYAWHQLDEDTLAALPASTHLLPQPLARAGVWTGLVQLVRAGAVPPSAVVELAEAGLPVETSAVLLGMHAAQATTIATRWAPVEQARELRARIAAALLPVVRADGDLQRRRAALEALLDVATTADQAAAVRAMVEGDMPAGLELDPGLRWSALGRLAALGDDVSALIAAARTADPDPDARASALLAAGAAPDPAAKDALWRAVIEEGSIGPGKLGALREAFYQYDQGAVLAPYAQRWLAEIGPFAADTGWMIAAATSRALFPQVGVDGAFADRASALAESGELPPTVTAEVVELVDELRRRLAVRGPA